MRETLPLQNEKNHLANQNPSILIPQHSIPKSLFYITTGLTPRHLDRRNNDIDLGGGGGAKKDPSCSLINWAS